MRDALRRLLRGPRPIPFHGGSLPVHTARVERRRRKARTRATPTGRHHMSSMIETPATEAQRPEDVTTPESEPHSPAVHAIVCAACGCVMQPITAEQVQMFLDGHQECRDATILFDVEVPASLGDDGISGMQHEVWARQAYRQGLRPFGSTTLLGNSEDPQRLVIRGHAVPADWREWDEMAGGYKEQETEDAVEHVAAGPTEALPDATEDVAWPPGGEPA